jgi:hypothetical protein
MNEHPRHVGGDEAGEGVGQEKEFTTPPPNRQSQEHANGVRHDEVRAHVFCIIR